MCSFTYEQLLDEVGMDAVIINGDTESGLESIIKNLKVNPRRTNKLEKALPGVVVAKDRTRIAGEYANPSDWGFPERSLLESYLKLRGNFLNEPSISSSIENTLELPITVKKGCRVNCCFCTISSYQGTKVRERDLDSMFAKISEIKEYFPLDLFSPYGADLCSDEAYTSKFAEMAKKSGVRWKGVASVNSLTPKMIKEFSEANCARIGIGLETFSKDHSTI